MTIRESIIAILSEVKPSVNFVEVDDIIDGAYIDSMELMVIITELSEQFNIEISFNEISPENFNSIMSIEKMIKRLLP